MGPDGDGDSDGDGVGVGGGTVPSIAAMSAWIRTISLGVRNAA